MCPQRLHPPPSSQISDDGAAPEDVILAEDAESLDQGVEDADNLATIDKAGAISESKLASKLALFKALQTADTLLSLASPEYSPNDIAVVNAMIANNGLGWTSATPDGSVADGWMTSSNVGWTTAAANKRIESLDVSGAGLSGALDVSDLTALRILRCNNNQLSSLDASNTTKLAGLYCQNNQLSSLDVSNTTNLAELYCQYNQLTFLDLSTTNTLFSFFSSNQSVSLTLLDDGSRSNYRTNVTMGTGSSFSGTDSGALSYNNGVLTSTNKNLATANFSSPAGQPGCSLVGTLTLTYEDTYLISFNAQGGSVSPASARTGMGGKLQELPVPTYTGYDFKGWYDAAAGGNAVSTSTVFPGDTTIDAQWTRKTYSGYWENANSTHTRNSGIGLTFVSTHEFSLHNGQVLVDGVALTEGVHYTAQAGSTRISLNHAYLTTLSAGDHTVSVGFGNSLPAQTASFSVVEPGNTGSTGSTGSTGNSAATSASGGLPSTGDTPLVTLSLVLLLGVAGSIALLLSKRLRRKTYSPSSAIQ